MFTARNQNTLAGPVAVDGFGYWSGRDVRVEFRPARIGAGIVFVRGDLPGQPRIPARIEYRVESPRRTTLRRGDARVEMIEHIMAALAGLRVDNCEVWADAPEMPGCDGSALPFVDAFDTVGIVAQDAFRLQSVVCTPVRIVDGESWIEAYPPAGERSVFRYHLDYGLDNAIGRQVFELAVTPESFRHELAPCRTFLFKSEADEARSRGIGWRATYRDLLVFGEDGPIENELRFASECVRHKVLDMVGDLALAGCDLIGRFRASRSGHRLNSELVRALVHQAEFAQCRKRCA
ncbi:MAG: UDP-3-O-[3-hydroxymyristoyl] N-acetylglucosamine deacetylase [Pirellulales bacterium]|nr:UDP-3-O-[3-hydroxymyristoyl] N-acetylglucosamine deacetylase [Pirellulales bacterium]